MKRIREFEVRTIMINKFNEVEVVAIMDLETYNEALTNYIEHIKDDSFNMGFEAGQTPYPTEEELANMDADDSKKE